MTAFADICNYRQILIYSELQIRIQFIFLFMRSIISKNPYTGVIKKKFDFLSNQDLDGKIKRAQDVYEVHRKRSIEERAALIEKLGISIQKRLKDAIDTVTFQTGKPIAQAEAEVRKAISFCKYYSKNYEPLLPITVKTDAKKKSQVKFFPIGIIYYLSPFNYPFYLNFKGGLPNLLLGNVLLARNADSCPMTGDLIEEIMKDAGLGNGQYQNVFTTYEQIDQIFQHNSVGGVSFTGSSKAGAGIAEKAGKYLKRAVMELGGNDPFVVLKDADVKLAVEKAIAGRCTNAGQVCFSPKRFIVAKEVYEEFKNGLIAGLKEIKFGDPTLPQTKMGPLAREDLIDNLQKQLKTLPPSYKIIFQRSEMKRPFFPITVIEGSDELFDEELFGPIYQLFKAESEEHAIKLANSGSYGLGGSVWSASRGEEVIDQIRCGLGFVNECPKSDTTFPSGGVGKSGFGRECWTQGYRSFANIKAHYVN